MAILDIVKDPNKILRQNSKEVDNINSDVKKLLHDMEETLNNIGGLGIAAPQVGTLKRIIVVKWEDNIYKVINPKIVNSRGKQIFIEGCISVDRQGDYIYGEVQRDYSIKVMGLDENGNDFEILAQEILAVIFQHEIDHLDGILFKDKVTGELLHFKNREERKAYKENVFIHRILER